MVNKHIDIDDCMVIHKDDKHMNLNDWQNMVDAACDKLNLQKIQVKFGTGFMARTAGVRASIFTNPWKMNVIDQPVMTISRKFSATMDNTNALDNASALFIVMHELGHVTLGHIERFIQALIVGLMLMILTVAMQWNTLTILIEMIFCAGFLWLLSPIGRRRLEHSADLFACYHVGGIDNGIAAITWIGDKGYWSADRHERITYLRKCKQPANQPSKMASKERKRQENELTPKNILTDHWIIYCDGSCAPNNPGPCAWGAVLVDPTGKEKEYSGFIHEHGTNNIAELTAAISALVMTPKGCRVTLYSDSQYVIKGLSEWVNGWMRKGWVNASGQPVANQPLWLTLKEAYDTRQVSLNWVKGHNNHRQNERADWLANKVLMDRRNAMEAVVKPIDQPLDASVVKSVESDCHAVDTKTVEVTSQGGKPDNPAAQVLNQAFARMADQCREHRMNNAMDTDYSVVPLITVQDCLLALMDRVRSVDADDPLLARVQDWLKQEMIRIESCIDH